jgi:hypothetical protein
MLKRVKGISIATDNLRRDFTFNLKIVEPKVRVKVKQGDIISVIIPIPRYFVDQFELAMAPNVFDPAVNREENIKSIKFQLRRDREDIHEPNAVGKFSWPNAVGKLFWRGQDADKHEFGDHQKKLRKPV